MVGKRNSVLSRIRQARQDDGCAQKGAARLSVKVDDLFIDLCYHFEKSVRRKAELRSYMEFTGKQVRKVLKYVSTRWLSLGKCVTRTLALCDTLRSYFISEFGDVKSNGAEREGAKASQGI